MLQNKNTSVVSLALLFALSTAPGSLAVSLAIGSVLAQSPTAPASFPLPTAVSTGTEVRIDGSTSMATINQALKQRFEEQYPGTEVNIDYTGSSTALQALLDGKLDLAAIGRPLTEDEKSQGLVAVPVARHKIAMVVGPNNPFTDSLTDQQFAQMFRGEITDWSQVGGPPGSIRFVDRPEQSDTRQAFRNYPVFKNAPFESGADTDKLSEDSTDGLIQALGTDGIGYAIVEQVSDRQDVRILAMHQTLPTDPRYPFSQPLSYVYKATSPSVLAFLGFATAAANRQVIEEARAVDATTIASSSTASPDTSASPVPTSPEATVPDATTSPETALVPAPGTDTGEASRGGFPWGWLLLPLALLGLLLGWWLKGRRQAAAPIEELAQSPTDLVGGVAPAPVPMASVEGIPPVKESDLAARAGAVISSDRIAVADNRLHPPAVATVPDAEAVATTAEPRGALPLGAAIVGGAAAAGAIVGGMAVGGLLADDRPKPKSRIVLTPRDTHDAYAYWEAPEAHKAELREQGGQQLALRLYDVTDIELDTQDPHSTQQFECDELEQDRHVPIPERDRDYLAEIGYLANNGDWFALARSNSIRMFSDNLVEDKTALGTALAGRVAVGTGAAAWEAPSGDSLTEIQGDRLPFSSSISLEPRELRQTLASWTVPEAHKAEVQQQGGQQLALRLYDVTGMDSDTRNSDSFQQFDCDEQAQEALLPVPQTERDYLAEIGYLTEAGRWLMLARSNAIHIPFMLMTVGGEPEIESEMMAAELDALSSPLSDDRAQSDVEAAKFDVGQSDLTAESLASVDEGLPDLPEGYGESLIVLMPRDPRQAYAYWDIPNEHKEEWRRQGGQRLALRLYDVTDIDVNTQAPHNLQQFDCDELARDWYIPVPVSDRDYILEIGYLTAEGHWLMLARSVPTRIPPIYPSSWVDERFVTLSWDEGLQGKNFLTLVPPSLRITDAAGNLIYDKVFDFAQPTEAQGVAGSLYGSMQMVPEQAVTSYIFPSGVGMGVFPTMSGITMSGIGMSGIGFSASAPPIRSRKFWLVADAELIVYGATEPDATLTIGDRPIQLNSDGTFRFQMSFQDGLIDYPILAVAIDGEQTRSVHLEFNRETPERNTNTRDEATDEWLS